MNNAVATIPASNIARFSSLALAKTRAIEGKYVVPVLLGDDGKFWVTSTPKEASRLIAAGYERAE